MNFCDILKKSEKKYLILIAILSCLHAMNGFMYSSIPFIFFDPVLTCTSNINGTLISFPCNQNTACDNFQYEINYEASYKSITTEFELICSQRFIKPTVQSLSLAGTAITGLTMSFVRLDPYKRSRIVMISYTIGATAALISSLLYNIWAITAAICIYYMFSYVWYSNIYTFASETFEPPLKKIVPSILSSCYGIGTMSFAMFTIKVDNWRYQMAFFYAIPTLFFLLCFFLHNRRHDFKPKNLEVEKEAIILGKQDQKPNSFFQAFKDKNLRKNILVYIFLWNMNSICYAGCDIALGSLSGRLAYTMFFLGGVQSICSLISGNLVLKFREEVLLKFSTVFMSIFFFVYIFEPQVKIDVETYISVIFTACIILGNIGIELNWTILVNLLQRYIHLEFQQNVFAFSDMISMVFTLLLPYYVELMLFLSISPIFGFGLLALLGRFFVNYLARIESVENSLIERDIGDSLEINNEPNNILVRIESVKNSLIERNIGDSLEINNEANNIYKKDLLELVMNDSNNVDHKTNYKLME